MRIIPKPRLALLLAFVMALGCGARNSPRSPVVAQPNDRLRSPGLLESSEPSAHRESCYRHTQPISTLFHPAPTLQLGGPEAEAKTATAEMAATRPRLNASICAGARMIVVLHQMPENLPRGRVRITVNPPDRVSLADAEHNLVIHPDLDLWDHVTCDDLPIVVAAATEEGPAIITASYEPAALSDNVGVSDTVTVSVIREMGALAVSTIAKNPRWPGQRPDGFEQRFGVPKLLSRALPSVPAAAIPDAAFGYATILLLDRSLLALFNSLLGGDSIKLSNLTQEDKRWLTLVMLQDLTNPDPPVLMDAKQVRSYLHHKTRAFEGYPKSRISEFEKIGNWRLANEFWIRCPVTANNRFVDDVVVSQKPLALIGPTKIPFPVLLSDLSIVWLNVAEPADRNDVIIGGRPGDAHIAHRAAGRVGPELEVYEAAVLPKRAPPFSSEIVFEIDEMGNMRSRVVGGDDPSCAWPSTFFYEWDASQALYVQRSIIRQTESPFDCFVSGGSAWPDPDHRFERDVWRKPSVAPTPQTKPPVD